MWKTKITAIIVLSIVFVAVSQAPSLFFTPNVSAGQTYLPKADLIKANGPEVYLLENGIRRWIKDPETFISFGYNWQNIKSVSGDVLESYSLGDDLRKGNAYPDGSLLRGSGPEVYLIELGKKRWIPTPQIFEANNFGWRYIVKVDDKVLDRLKRDNDLVISEPNRYPETMILSAPRQEQIINQSEVLFKYSGINPLGPNSDLSFETFLVGYGQDWKNQGKRYEITYRLPEQSQAYIFYVRAKNKEGYVDATPSKTSFSVGVSSYYGQIEIGQVRPKEKDFPKDYLVLRNTDKDRRTIDITGWKIELKMGTIIIPKAIEKLRLPFSVSDKGNLKLAYSGEVIISSGLSPQGFDFQENKCTGYLTAAVIPFYPFLDKRCPRLEKSEYTHLKPVCRKLIDSLSTCEMPDYSNNYDISSDRECTDFLIKNFGYDQCYLGHYQEPDFLSGDWRVFLNRAEDIFNNESDTIILKDRNGSVVDKYSY